MNSPQSKPLTTSRVLRMFIGLTLFCFSLTVLFFGMRSVMEIGGFCAVGGPYEIKYECPEGVAGLMAPAPIFMLIGIFLYASAASNLAFPIIFFWSAIFISLGWNFLELGLNPPGGEGVAVAWLVNAVIFGIMGLGPLLAVIPMRKKVSKTKPPSPLAAADVSNTRTLLILMHIVGIVGGVYGGIYLFRIFT